MSNTGRPMSGMMMMISSLKIQVGNMHVHTYILICIESLVPENESHSAGRFWGQAKQRFN